MEYHREHKVHWIQARKASEDRQSWRSAQVLSVEGETITVRFGDGEEARFRSGWADLITEDGATRVSITETWGVLAYPDRGGKRMLAIIRLEEFVYATVMGVDANEYFFVVPRAEAEDVADIMRIMQSCTTWGEVREAASLERYQEILGRAGYGSLDEYVEHIFVGRPIPGALEAAARRWEEENWENGLPADDDPFDPNDIDSYSCGDYPPMFELIQNDSLPADLINRLGNRYETTINGTFASFPVEVGSEVIADLESRGHLCVEEKDLIQGAMARW